MHQIKAALPGMTLCQDRPRQPLLIISLHPSLQLMFLHVLNAEETLLLPPAMSVALQFCGTLLIRIPVLQHLE